VSLNKLRNGKKKVDAHGEGAETLDLVTSHRGMNGRFDEKSEPGHSVQLEALNKIF
jgi:hypothetical protein